MAKCLLDAVHAHRSINYDNIIKSNKTTRVLMADTKCRLAYLFTIMYITKSIKRLILIEQTKIKFPQNGAYLELCKMKYGKGNLHSIHKCIFLKCIICFLNDHKRFLWDSSGVILYFNMSLVKM